jgi:hypothetical protein
MTSEEFETWLGDWIGMPRPRSRALIGQWRAEIARRLLVSKLVAKPRRVGRPLGSTNKAPLSKEREAVKKQNRRARDFAKAVERFEQRRQLTAGHGFSVEEIFRIMRLAGHGLSAKEIVRILRQ